MLWVLSINTAGVKNDDFLSLLHRLPENSLGEIAGNNELLNAQREKCLLMSFKSEI